MTATLGNRLHDARGVPSPSEGFPAGFPCHRGWPDSAWRRLASARIALISWPNFAAKRSRVRWMSSIVESRSFWFVIFDKFLGCADHRNRDCKIVQHGMNPRQDSTVCDVSAVPGQQIVNSMMGRDRDVKGVEDGLRRQNCPHHDFVGDDLHLRFGRQQRNSFQGPQSVLCQGSFSIRRFIDDVLRCHKVVFASL